jgi:hypothetical protein
MVRLELIVSRDSGLENGNQNRTRCLRFNYERRNQSISKTAVTKIRSVFGVAKPNFRSFGGKLGSAVLRPELGGVYKSNRPGGDAAGT